MARALETLPLFPLETVLFPHASLRLHVFEDRYRELVRVCLDRDEPFGVVLIRRGAEVGGFGAEPYLVGTTARIRDVHRYEDGRLDLLVQGERRFRIRRLEDDLAPYPVGFVEPVLEHDLDEPVRAERVFAEAREEVELLLKRFFERQNFAVQVVFPPDPVDLSFTIANLLAMENLQKQRLLETTDTVDRIEELLPLLRNAVLESSSTPGFHRVTPDELREWTSPN